MGDLADEVIVDSTKDKPPITTSTSGSNINLNNLAHSNIKQEEDIVLDRNSDNDSIETLEGDMQIMVMQGRSPTNKSEEYIAVWVKVVEKQGFTVTWPVIGRKIELDKTSKTMKIQLTSRRLDRVSHTIRHLNGELLVMKRGRSRTIE